MVVKWHSLIRPFAVAYAEVVWHRSAPSESTRVLASRPAELQGGLLQPKEIEYWIQSVIDGVPCGNNGTHSQYHPVFKKEQERLILDVV